jgi:hypothetical protein
VSHFVRSFSHFGFCNTGQFQIGSHASRTPLSITNFGQGHTSLGPLSNLQEVTQAPNCLKKKKGQNFGSNAEIFEMSNTVLFHSIRQGVLHVTAPSEFWNSDGRAQRRYAQTKFVPGADEPRCIDSKVTVAATFDIMRQPLGAFGN